MSALASVLRLLQPGDAVLASKDIYGGMHRLLRYSAVHAGIEVKFVETWNIEEVIRTLNETPNARLLCVESPTNPMMRQTHTPNLELHWPYKQNLILILILILTNWADPNPYHPISKPNR